MTSNKDPTDCLECRLVSGFGVLAMGAYIYSQASKRKPLEKRVIQVIGGTTGTLGLARLFNLPPFRRKTTASNKSE